MRNKPEIPAYLANVTLRGCSRVFFVILNRSMDEISDRGEKVPVVT